MKGNAFKLSKSTFLTWLYLGHSFQICILNDSENMIFSICPLYSLGNQLPIYILVYFKRTIIVVPTLDFCTSV